MHAGSHIGSTGEIPDEDDYLVPLGKAKVLREGKDVTIVAIGQMHQVALRAAKALEDSGVDAEVIDPRTIAPMDMETIRNSVEKTGRLCVVHEGHGPFGISAEIIASITETSLHHLKAPPARVTPPFAPSPFTPSLEKMYLPSPERVFEVAKRLVGEFA